MISIMSAPNYSSQKTSKLPFVGKMSFFQIFLTLLFITQKVHIRQVKAECSTYGTYGCPLTAVDIWYGDSPFKEALAVLRRSAKKSSDDDDDDDDDDAINRALATLKVAGDEKRTLLTLRGMKGGRLEDQINQDRALMVSPFHILPPDSNSNSSNSRLPSAQLLGIFDGHGGGGELTSNYAMGNFPSLLAAKLAQIYIKDSDDNDNDGDNDSSIVQALKEVFIDVDRKDPSKNWVGGSTATVVLQIGNKLFVANAGDSVSFVGVYFGGKSTAIPLKQRIQIVYQSREDKPDIPEEKARIVAAGGYVHIPLDGDGNVPRVYHIDENGLARYGLAMSRSLGDWGLQGVTAEPIVDVLDLKDIVQTALTSYVETCSSRNNDKEKLDEKEQYCDALNTSDIHIFATSISDGMMDYLSPEDIGNVLAESFFDEGSKLHPHTAAEQLVNEAATGWENEFRGQYRDDIAIASFVVPFF